MVGTPIQALITDPDHAIGPPPADYNRGYYVQPLENPTPPLERVNVDDIHFLIPDDGRSPQYSLKWTIDTYGDTAVIQALYVYDILSSKLLQGDDLQTKLSEYFSSISGNKVLLEQAYKAFYRNPAGEYYRKTNSSVVDRREIKRFKDYLDITDDLGYLGINVGQDPSDVVHGARHGEIIIFTEPDENITLKGVFSITHGSGSSGHRFNHIA